MCSEHFKQSDFRRTEGLGLLRLSNAALPSLFSWPEKAKKSRRALVRGGEQPSTGQVAEEQQSRTLSDREDLNVIECDSVDGAPPQTVSPPYLDHDYCLHGTCKEREEHITINKLLLRNEELELELKKCSNRSITIAALKDQPHKFRHFTGLPNYETFVHLRTYFRPKAERLEWWRGSYVHNLPRGQVYHGEYADADSQLKISSFMFWCAYGLA